MTHCPDPGALAYGLLKLSTTNQWYTIPHSAALVLHLLYIVLYTYRILNYIGFALFNNQYHMSKATYTKEQKQKYFADLRGQWKQAKEYSEVDKYKAMHAEASRTGVRVSATGFTFTLMQMEQLNLEGMPYVDAKTFNGWKDSGYRVRKGEKSIIKGITFIKPKDDEDNNSTFVFPKVYSLFHKTQVEAIA